MKKYTIMGCMADDEGNVWTTPSECAGTTWRPFLYECFYNKKLLDEEDAEILWISSAMFDNDSETEKYLEVAEKLKWKYAIKRIKRIRRIINDRIIKQIMEE